MPQVLDRIRNGVDSAQMYGTLDAIEARPELGVFQFRARNRWVDGAHNQSTIQGFSLVYVATARKVRLTEVTSTLEGDMDVRGCLGLSDELRNGFSGIRVRVGLKCDAPEEELREIVERAQARSAVHDMVSNGVPVAVEVATP